MKKKIIIIGGNRINEINPLNSILKLFKNYNYDFELITSTIHLNKPCSSKASFGDYLKSNKIKHKIIDYYDQLFIYLKKIKKNHDILILLLHTTFLLKNDIINEFKNKIFNYHIGSLPDQRGGAPGSWQTLMSRKSTSMTIHRVLNKIDAGNKMHTKKITIKKNQSLKNFYYNIQKNEYNFFKNFFINCDKNKIGKKQDEKQSIYMPRLKTKVHGYINWSWSALEIYNFIRSFDHPFEGARTFINNKEVVIKDIKLLKKKYNFHPFQNGIIFKKEKNSYFIACKQFALKTDNIKNKNNEKLKIKLLGKRLYTPYSILDRSMTARSVQKPKKDTIRLS
jgi:methionyl-tRNA formyltransferase